MPKRNDGRGGHGFLNFGLGALSAGAILSVVAGGYKTAEFLVHAKRLTEVSHENSVYVRIMERIRLDLAECDRLLKLPEVKHAMGNARDKLGWIQRTITAMKESLQEMNKYVYRVAGDVEKGKWIGVKNRFRWVLDDSEKALRCRGEVGICHEGLLEVLSLLSSFEPLNCCPREKEDGQYEEEIQYEDEDYDLQKRYEEKARYILQQERGFQGRAGIRSEEVFERDDRYEREPEERYNDRSEARHEERPQRRGNDSYSEDRGGYVDREIRVTQHEEYVPTRSSRDRVVYDREESPQQSQGEPGQLRVHWPDN